MPNVALNYAQPFTVKIVCNLPTNWEIQRTRTATANLTWSGSTAAPTSQSAQIIPANTFAAGDTIDWGADVFAPPTANANYSIQVELTQGSFATSMTHTGSVVAAGYQIEVGNWTCT